MCFREKSGKSLRLLLLVVWIGSNVIVAGTSIFSASSPKDVIATFRKAVDDGIEARNATQKK